ncbi:MAG: hypothetical protein ACREXR_19030 [Gammaproteobacteria bacterium]
MPCDSLLPRQDLVAPGQFSGEDHHETASKPGYRVNGDDIQVGDAHQNKALLSRDKLCDINAQDDIEKSSNE